MTTRCTSCRLDYCACDDYYRSRLDHWRKQQQKPDKKRIPMTDKSEWQPISDFHYREYEAVDLWCIDGDENVACWGHGENTTPIGKLVTRRHWTKEYGWHGNNSRNGVPNGHGRDLVPVAWCAARTVCPVSIIQQETGFPLPTPPNPQEKEILE